MLDYEKLGVFYLGRQRNLESGETSGEAILYDSKDLTTHAVIVGMTGSGKTGLGITLLEEAAIDGIPAIIIDPKGDMGNLLLNFPQMSAEDLTPWIEEGEAARHARTVAEHATAVSQQWRTGLAEWEQPIERIAKLRDAADMTIYTPGSTAGIPLTVLKSFAAPSAEVIKTPDAFRERVMATVSGILGLLGIDADPIRSREHILLSNILGDAWQKGQSLDMKSLIGQIQNPPFATIGVMEVDSVFPPADRMELAMAVNNLLASPGFAAWREGEPLQIQRLLYTPDGKPRLAVISIAHLSDAERMFFVTILLNEMVSWMRAQTGTTSLRALLYMDEVFGYLPPTANPPSKLPMLTLLKQARAFGLGLVLATQNPVDLDYKALSNAGTWFLGRLQTERDKARVLDGLEGASAASGKAFDRRTIEQTLSGLGNRVFLMNNVHEDAPVVFQTRWALSFLRGPLTRDQIAGLMADRKAAAAESTPAVANQPAPDDTAAPPAAPAVRTSAPPASSASSPILPPSVIQKYLAIAGEVAAEAHIEYRPALLGQGRLHFVDSKSHADCWNDVVRVVVVGDKLLPRDPWEDAESWNHDLFQTDDQAAGDAAYVELPAELLKAKSYISWRATFKVRLYQAERLHLFYCGDLKEYSKPGETEGDMRVRLSQRAREQRDAEIEKLRVKHAKDAERLQEKLRKAQQRVEREEAQASAAKTSAIVSFGQTVLGAIMGRKVASVTNVTRAGSSARAAGRAAQQGSDVNRAEDDVETLQQEVVSLQAVVEQEMNAIRGKYEADRLTFTPYAVTPRKSDITVEDVMLLWMPWQSDGQSPPTPAWDKRLNAPSA
jgi:hypothetical protein